MSENNELEIKFRIQHIETLQFAILQENITQDKLAFEVGFGFGVDTKSQIIRSTFRYHMISDLKSCLIIEVAVDFLIEHETYKKKFILGNQIIIEKGFASHLAVVTVGATRGILHEKTRKSPLNAFPIPTVNITSQITADIAFVVE